MGRKSYLPKDRRRNQVAVYLTDHEYEAAYHAAIKQDMPIAGWIRKAILREVEKEEGLDA
jgi:hypothetical protein